jgi:UDP-N-acetylglucosamine diphosphorylase / glucose-1-phosphate thymidylyltransferase / UDP-N-acetylgalactosamine diphosphorylase / glucosamine-1-phosphate N-acetyltransferase / galactosamine-1-phosphate N-acetyltransferase
MSRPALVLFDDAVARGWRPFTLTRPAGELLFGTRTLRARAEAAYGLACAGHVAGDALTDYDEPWAPSVITPDRVGGDGDVLWLSSRFVAEPAPLPDRPALLTAHGRVVGARLAGDSPPGPGFLLDPDASPPGLPRHAVDGVFLDRVWELMSGNAARVARDLAGVERSQVPPHVHVVGHDAISLGRDVEVAPGVVLDTRHGPIRLEDGVVVRPFTHLVGPAWVGPGSTLLGGPLTAVSIGPRCKIHGEVEETVVLGYSNKAHDGFLGHAYVGMWVNLGAMTTNSDLKNNYGPVRIWTPNGETDTGESKIGCFLGDHVKTAIGTLLNTGTVVEAGSNIFGGMPPKYVPPFSWGEPDAVYDFDRFAQTAQVVMARRDVELTGRGRAMLRTAWDMERGEPR